MCGITGISIFKQKDAPLLKNVDGAVASMAHRGPNFAHSIRLDKIALGHARLSIIDVSDAANQPFVSDCGNFILVYNGEIYNYLELKNTLLKQGIDFKTQSDTEVLLKLLIAKGAGALNELNGFFAFAFYNKSKNSLLLARDRAGIKPLYYYHDNTQFSFASELKTLFNYNLTKEIDTVSLFTYLQFNYIPAPNSIIKNVKKVLPGHYLYFENIADNSFKEERYYEIAHTPDENKLVNNFTYNHAQAELKDLVTSAVERRLVSDVPLGTFLSGGIDSSIVTAIAAEKSGNIDTFSIGYKEDKILDESYYANLVARKYNTKHHTFYFNDANLVDTLYSFLENNDEPFADSSAIAVNLLSKLTRQHVTVALSGDGADELFSGYNKHMAEYKLRQFGPVKSLLKLSAPMLKLLPHSRNSKFGNIARKLSKFAEGSKHESHERYWRWATLCSEESANYLLKESMVFKSQRLSDDAHVYKKRKDSILKDIKTYDDFNSVLLTDMNLVLPNDMLTKVDRMSMLNSLEVRTPFLDHHVIDFAAALPVSFKINNEMMKKILQDTFRDKLPAEIYNRPKHGFEVPILKWIKDELRSLINEELLADTFIEKQGIFNAEGVRQLKTKVYSSNPGDTPATVWAMVVFQKWWLKNIADA